MSQGHPLDAKSEELQARIDQLSQTLHVPSMAVGQRTSDGLSIYIADDGFYHFAFYERGYPNLDNAGGLDDVLYWYCENIVTSQAARQVGDRAQRFAFEYQVLSQFNPEWAKRRVRELAATFRNGQPEDLALLPNIGEPL